VGTKVVTDNAYQYNDAGDLVQNTDLGGTHAFGYDVLDRLTSASYPKTTSESYSYDAIGNRANSQRSSTYNYQPFNRLVGTTAASYVYDNNGNLTTKTENGKSTNFGWDFENRLTQVVTPASESVSYKYDALGRRIQRAGSDGVGTNFTYDGQDVIKDVNNDGSTVDYLNGPGIDNKVRQTSTVKKKSTAFYFATDHLGSTTALTNDKGHVVDEITYDAFGNGTGSKETRYDYTGRERDPLTGLMYYRARWYDPQIGRFISEDPIGLAGGINQFAYVGNSPQNAKDPSGLYDIDVHYYLTYYLARSTGCFDDSQARQIAEGDQHSDEDADKKPGWGKKWVMTWHGPVAVADEDQRRRNADFHAFGTPAQNARRAGVLLAQASQGGGNVWAFGTYLHFIQDSYSHRDFAGNTTWGQTSGGKSVDHTNFDPGKALDMAHDTYDKLKRFGEMRGCPCHGNPDWDAVRRFIDVGYDLSTPAARAVDFVSDVSNEQLWRKIGILNVPWRSSTGR